VKKAEITRRHLLDVALARFRKHGFEATTMRDIAKDAGLALGAAYYHFPSKDALLFAYYADNLAVMEQRAAAYPAADTLRGRVGRLIHDKLDDVAPNRRLLAALVPRLVDPGDPVSAFSAESAQVRDRTIALFEGALAGEPIPDDLRRLSAQGLWLLHLTLLLYVVGDHSRGISRSHRLADDLLDLAVPLLAMAATPLGRPLISQLRAALVRAGLAA
jgi:AcrR family transcriptional regulator